MSKLIKKITPYFLVLTILVGLLSFEGRAYAEDGNCIITIKALAGNEIQGHPSHVIRTADQTSCTAAAEEEEKDLPGIGSSATGAWAAGPAASGGATPQEDSALSKNIPGCAIITGDFDDCLVKISYYVFYAIPSFVLGLTASLLNVLLAITLSSKLYENTFISNAWKIVRDLSNIFFILVLLYISIKVILGLGGSEVKKMIVQVILMALLINFSMFITKVVIDSSNILALIFYNRINTEYTNTTASTTTPGTPIPPRSYLSVTNPATIGIQEKDIAGGLASAFKPGEFLTQEFFDKVKTRTQAGFTLGGAATYVGGGALAGSFIPIVGTAIGAGIGAGGYAAKIFFGMWVPEEVPNSLLMGIILVSGLIMLFATYSFFIAGISFLGRLIELWILIIFSPFAFMSSTIPLLSGIPGVGWKGWLHRLLEVAFMAPIFMFMLYLIFKIVQLDIFKDLADRPFAEQGTFEAIVILGIKALIVLILLNKATSYAKKGSGELGAMLIKGTEIAMGVAGGLALGGVAAAGQASIGRGAAYLSESNRLRDFADKSRWGGAALRATSTLAKSEFDARKGAMGGVLKAAGGVSGLNLGHSSKFLMRSGGYIQDRADVVKKQEEFVSKQIDVSDTGKAEMTRGKMPPERARALVEKMTKGGMVNAGDYYSKLVGNGVDTSDIGNVVNHINAGRREIYADRLDKRSKDTQQGKFMGFAKRFFPTKRIISNKIRKTAKNMAKKSDIDALVSALKEQTDKPEEKKGEDDKADHK